MTEAFDAYDKALALQPDSENGLGLVAAMPFTGLKRYDEAFAAYDKALALKPDLAEALGSVAAMSLSALSAMTMRKPHMTKRWRSSPIWQRRGLVAATVYVCLKRV